MSVEARITAPQNENYTKLVRLEPVSSSNLVSLPGQTVVIVAYPDGKQQFIGFRCNNKDDGAEVVIYETQPGNGNEVLETESHKIESDGIYQRDFVIHGKEIATLALKHTCYLSTN